MGDKEGALVREVVVEVGNDLDSNICLPCAGRPHNKTEPRLHPRHDGLHLRGREGDGVPV